MAGCQTAILIYIHRVEDLNEAFEAVRTVWRAAGWPGVVEDLSYGTPALKVRGKLLLRLREPGIVVLLCDLDEKEFLMQAMPEVYFETDHYKGYPAVLARLETIDRDALADHIEKRWRAVAGKKLVAEFDTRCDR